MPVHLRMKWLRALKRTMIILVLYGIGVLEAYFIPRHGYGLEWVLAAIGLTAFLAGYWVRTRWND